VKKQVDYYLNASKLLQIEKYVSRTSIVKRPIYYCYEKHRIYGSGKRKVDKLSQDVMPKAAQEEYNKGRELYNRKITRKPWRDLKDPALTVTIGGMR